MGKKEKAGVKVAPEDGVTVLLMEILAELNKAKARDASIMRALHVIELHTSGDAVPDRPWRMKFDKAKSDQIDLVCDYLKEHPTASINAACDKVYRFFKGGYTLAGLRHRCYMLNIPQYARKERTDEGELSPKEALAVARLGR